MIQNIVKLSCLGLFLSLISCGDETLPKPKGQLSLEYPKAKYSKLESNCSFTFDKNNLALIKVLVSYFFVSVIDAKVFAPPILYYKISIRIFCKLSQGHYFLTEYLQY